MGLETRRVSSPCRCKFFFKINFLFSTLLNDYSGYEYGRHLSSGVGGGSNTTTTITISSTISGSRNGA
jgi:hypothetical protein